MNATIAPGYGERDTKTGSASERPGDKLKDTAQAGVEQAKEAAGSVSEKASEYVQKAADTASSAARHMAEQGRDAGQRVQEVAGNVKGALAKSAREQPMITLAVAAAIGFMIGALWKS